MRYNLLLFADEVDFPEIEEHVQNPFLLIISVGVTMAVVYAVLSICFKLYKIRRLRAQDAAREEADLNVDQTDV